jgi:nucleotidyltransferase substrate binding protein (TIGR01987 family)
VLKQMDHPDEITKEVFRDSIVKKYEILEDQLWKLLSKIFKVSGLELNSPRACYRQAFKEGWIENIDVWNDILSSRNATAHVYNEEDYERIKNKIVDEYVHEIEKLLEKIKEEVIDHDVRN